VLHVAMLEGSHTGTLIAERIEDMLLRWRISKERVHLNNASNMDRALKDADIVICTQSSVSCPNGVLSQCDLLAICQSIVGHFKRSTKATDKLKDIHWVCQSIAR